MARADADGWDSVLVVKAKDQGQGQMVKSTKPPTPQKTTVRCVTGATLSDIINKKQCTETRQSINQRLLQKHSIEAKIKHFLNSGAFDETHKTTNDRVSSSTNNLLSREHVLDALEYILLGSTAAIKTHRPY